VLLPDEQRREVERELAKEKEQIAAAAASRRVCFYLLCSQKENLKGPLSRFNKAPH
jgi:hypothetical protein